MTNYSVYNSQGNFVYSQSINTFVAPGIVAPPATGAASAGRMFAVNSSNSLLVVLSGSVTTSLQITNSSGSGVNLYVSSVLGGIGIALSLLSSFTGTMTMAQGGTFVSSSPLTPFNTRLSSPTASGATARSATAAPSGAAAFTTVPLDPGLFQLAVDGGIVVPPNQSLTVTVSGSLSVAGTIAVYANITWWEA
ncbi:hypothetical protein [Paenibacillus cymbidii]|uniref:hypothetical protein n=1 Tax=Paenibacillus cymbidii TaxID=1639034 RepID=UPI00108004D9|nr:hypothetical protein [Paenibacillus cymbidii]